MRSLPTYAQGVDAGRLVKVFCKGRCCKTHWHVLNKPHEGYDALRKAPMAEYRATCLVCGSEALDNCTWLEVCG